jgi:hypothetical protein
LRNSTTTNFLTTNFQSLYLTVCEHNPTGEITHATSAAGSPGQSDEALRAQGLFKHERIIASPQQAAVTLAGAARC